MMLLTSYKYFYCLILKMLEILMKIGIIIIHIIIYYARMLCSGSCSCSDDGDTRQGLLDAAALRSFILIVRDITFLRTHLHKKRKRMMKHKSTYIYLCVHFVVK